MNDTAKKYLKVSLTLGIIAGASALLIGLTNMITADVIKANSEAKEKNGLNEVYSSSEFDYSDIDVTSSSYEYITKIWKVSTKADNSDKAYIYKTSGTNAYGSVTMLVGIGNDLSVGKIVLLENGESYATTLEDNYVNKVNDGKSTIEDVSCGATYGAKLVRSMIKEALSDCEVRVK